MDGCWGRAGAIATDRRQSATARSTRMLLLLLLQMLLLLLTMALLLLPARPRGEARPSGGRPASREDWRAAAAAPSGRRRLLGPHGIGAAPWVAGHAASAGLAAKDERRGGGTAPSAMCANGGAW